MFPLKFDCPKISTPTVHVSFWIGNIRSSLQGYIHLCSHCLKHAVLIADWLRPFSAPGKLSPAEIHHTVYCQGQKVSDLDIDCLYLVQKTVSCWDPSHCVLSRTKSEWPWHWLFIFSPENCLLLRSITLCIVKDKKWVTLTLTVYI